MKQYYEILELHESATMEEIKSAYKKLSKKYHPDLHHGNALEELASEKFRQIKEAYDILIKELNYQDKNSFITDNEDISNFNLYGLNLNFSDESLNYNLFRSNLNRKIENYIEIYEINYLSYGSLDNFIKMDMNYTINIIKEFIDLTVKRAIAIGCDIYSVESFYKKYGGSILSDYRAAYNELNSALELIEYNKSVQDYQRKFEHDLNFKKSVFTHVGNLAKKVSISTEASSNKKNYYENQETLEALLNIIEGTFLDIIDVACSIVGFKGREVFREEFSCAIYDNIDLYETPIKKEKICQALNSYPYLIELYTYALNSYGDSNGELERMASVFGIPLKHLKENIKERLYNECEERIVGNFDLAKEKIKSHAKFYGVSYDDLLKRIEKEIRIKNFKENNEEKLIEIDKITNISERYLTNYIDAVNKIEAMDIPEEIKIEKVLDLKNEIEVLKKEYRVPFGKWFLSLIMSLFVGFICIVIGVVILVLATKMKSGFFKWLIYFVGIIILVSGIFGPISDILERRKKSKELKNLDI